MNFIHSRKTRRQGFVTVLTAVVLLFIPSHNCNSQARKKTVDRFLTAWLVRKDVPKALSFFHPQSFAYVSVIDSCAREDYISESDVGNEKAIKAGVSKFLVEGTSHIKGRRLGEILFLVSKESPQQSKELARLKPIAFNDTRRDRYYLVTLDAIKQTFSGKDDWDDFEKRFDLRGAFVSMIQYRVLNEDPRYGDDIAVMLLWVRAPYGWKIAFVGVPSCQA